MAEVFKAWWQLGTSGMPLGWSLLMGVCILAVFLLLR